MSAAELINRLSQAKVHLERTRDLVRSAHADVLQARELLQAALQGTSNQAVASIVERLARQLGETNVRAEQSIGKVEEVLARVRGLGSLGNWQRVAVNPVDHPLNLACLSPYVGRLVCCHVAAAHTTRPRQSCSPAGRWCTTPASRRSRMVGFVVGNCEWVGYLPQAWD